MTPSLYNNSTLAGVKNIRESEWSRLCLIVYLFICGYFKPPQLRSWAVEGEKPVKGADKLVSLRR